MNRRLLALMLLAGLLASSTGCFIIKRVIRADIQPAAMIHSPQAVHGKIAR